MTKKYLWFTGSKLLHEVQVWEPGGWGGGGGGMGGERREGRKQDSKAAGTRRNFAKISRNSSRVTEATKERTRTRRTR